MKSRTGAYLGSLALAAALVLPAAAMADGGSSHGGGSGHHNGGGHSSGHPSHGGGHGNHGGHGGHSYGPSRGYWGGYVGVGGWGWYGYPSAYYGGYGWYAPPSWSYTSVYPAAGATHGALDLDVSPESAQIYVDGNLVGIADDFDGYPNFLWLEKGTYDVVIFAPGYQTIARQYSVYGGLVIDVEDQMVPGKETLPQDLVSKQTVNRDERLRRDRETEAEARAFEERGGDRSEPEGVQGIDARGEPGTVRLSIEPGDASVYLDGRFLGTGRELARLRSGLIVDAGEHRIEVVRPGRQSEERSFSVNAGEEVRLDIALEED